MMAAMRTDSQPGTNDSDHARPPHASMLGIDPGLQRTGYALLSDEGPRCVLLEAGIISLDPRQPLHRRLVELAEALSELIDRWHPAVMACEQLFAHYRHPRTALLMAHARGVILAEAARSGVQIISISATRVKKTLTGSGRAGKEQVQRAIAATLGLTRLPEPNDVADAAAIGLCGIILRRSAERMVASTPVQGVAS